MKRKRDGDVKGIWNFISEKLSLINFLHKYEIFEEYVCQLETCGFLPDTPTRKDVKRLQKIARAIAFIQVGRIKIKGRKNLKVRGPHMVISNHPHYADVVSILPIVMNGPARYMLARGVFTSLFGLGGFLAGAFGAFAVDIEKGKGGPAREVAVQVLTSGQRLVMFPEGWAWLDGEMREFHRGASMIAKEAAATLGRKTYIVPVHLRYGRYPGQWITKLPAGLQYLLVFLMFWRYRRGVTVTVGKPIPSTKLPRDDVEATEFLRQSVLNLNKKL
jgi:1-acyl-sn-glycerol-3-phosphate acyltransferase